MSADDIFMGWAFMVVIGPIYAILQAIITLPSTLFSRYMNKRAGFIAWILTMMAILIYLFFPISINANAWSDESGAYIVKSIFMTLFYLAPQAAAYPLTTNHPWKRPLAAGAIQIGFAILYIILGAAFGATPD